MPSELIERMARAICKASTQEEHLWQAFVPEATAALAAIREPTERMVDAVLDADLDINWSYSGIGPGSPDDVWRTMIDAEPGDG